MTAQSPLSAHQRADEIGGPVGPKRIWLHGYGSFHDEVTWCDDPNPSGEPEEAESAVEYIRADLAPPPTASTPTGVEAELIEALKTADDAIREMFRYYDGGEARGSYDGRPERAQLRKAGYKTRALLARIQADPK